MEAPGRQNQVPFPPGARSCLDAQNVAMSNRALVITGRTVWGGPQTPDGQSETVVIEGVIRPMERHPPHTQSLCVGRGVGSGESHGSGQASESQSYSGEGKKEHSRQMQLHIQGLPIQIWEWESQGWLAQ